MPDKCSAVGCDTGRDDKLPKDPNVHLFSFPSDPEMVRKWVLALKRDNFSPTKYSRVCSTHFHDDCLEWRRTDRTTRRSKNRSEFRQKPRLVHSAVPTIFPGLPWYLSKTTTPAKRSTAATSSSRLQLQQSHLEDTIQVWVFSIIHF